MGILVSSEGPKMLTLVQLSPLDSQHTHVKVIRILVSILGATRGKAVAIDATLAHKKSEPINASTR
jgi:hypothetical protein